MNNKKQNKQKNTSAKPFFWKGTAKQLRFLLSLKK